MKRIRFFLAFYLFAIQVYAATVHNMTIQVGEVITIQPFRPNSNHVYANLYENSNPSVAGVSIEITTPDGILKRYIFRIVGLQSGTTTINIGAVSKQGEIMTGYATYVINVVEVKSVSIPSRLSLFIGNSYTFSPVITDVGATTTLTWQSSNPAVASVYNGTITTHSVGTTIISCFAHNGVSSSCTVTVEPIKVSGIILNTPETMLPIGGKLKLFATITPVNATNKSVTWSSSNESVAVVNESGTVLAVGSGLCQIKAMANDGSGKSASCIVNVKDGQIMVKVNGDVNKDGTVNVADIANIIDIMAGDNVIPNYLFCPDSNHPHLIDMGLPSGTKWACCNVGSITPECYKAHIAWGETQVKGKYLWRTYQYGYYSEDGDYSHLENIGADIAGTIYDAATANWGAPWRMPSVEQYQELMKNCKSMWTTQDGVSGWKFTGPNGGTIFLPAEGYIWDTTLNNPGIGGHYWTSTLFESAPYRVWHLYFSSEGIYILDSAYRCSGLSLRPIAK